MQDTSFYCCASRCTNIVAYPVKKINISFLRLVKLEYNLSLFVLHLTETFLQGIRNITSEDACVCDEKGMMVFV